MEARTSSASGAQKRTGSPATEPRGRMKRARVSQSPQTPDDGPAVPTRGAPSTRSDAVQERNDLGPGAPSPLRNRSPPSGFSTARHHGRGGSKPGYLKPSSLSLNPHSGVAPGVLTPSESLLHPFGIEKPFGRTDPSPMPALRGSNLFHAMRVVEELAALRTGNHSPDEVMAKLDAIRDAMILHSVPTHSVKTLMRKRVLPRPAVRATRMSFSPTFQVDKLIITATLKDIFSALPVNAQLTIGGHTAISLSAHKYTQQKHEGRDGVHWNYVAVARHERYCILVDSHSAGLIAEKLARMHLAFEPDNEGSFYGKSNDILVNVTTMVAIIADLESLLATEALSEGGRGIVVACGQQQSFKVVRMATALPADHGDPDMGISVHSHALEDEAALSTVLALLGVAYVSVTDVARNIVCKRSVGGDPKSVIPCFGWAGDHRCVQRYPLFANLHGVERWLAYGHDDMVGAIQYDRRGSVRGGRTGEPENKVVPCGGGLGIGVEYFHPYQEDLTSIDVNSFQKHLDPSRKHLLYDLMMMKQAITVHGKVYPLCIHGLCSHTNKRKLMKTGVHRKDVMAYVVNRQENEAECLARHIDGMHHELLAHGRVETTTVAFGPGFFYFHDRVHAGEEGEEAGATGCDYPFENSDMTPAMILLGSCIQVEALTADEDLVVTSEMSVSTYLRFVKANVILLGRTLCNHGLAWTSILAQLVHAGLGFGEQTHRDARGMELEAVPVRAFLAKMHAEHLGSLLYGDERVAQSERSARNLRSYASGTIQFAERYSAIIDDLFGFWLALSVPVDQHAALEEFFQVLEEVNQHIYDPASSGFTPKYRDKDGTAVNMGGIHTHKKNLKATDRQPSAIASEKWYIGREFGAAWGAKPHGSHSPKDFCAGTEDQCLLSTELSRQLTNNLNDALELGFTIAKKKFMATMATHAEDMNAALSADPHDEHGVSVETWEDGKPRIFATMVDLGLKGQKRRESSWIPHHSGNERAVSDIFQNPSLSIFKPFMRQKEDAQDKIRTFKKMQVEHNAGFEMNADGRRFARDAILAAEEAADSVLKARKMVYFTLIIHSLVQNHLLDRTYLVEQLCRGITEDTKWGFDFMKIHTDAEINRAVDLDAQGIRRMVSDKLSSTELEEEKDEGASDA